MTPPRYLLTLAVLLGTLAQPLPADIYRWDNGQVIPGTEGITSRDRGCSWTIGSWSMRS